MPPSISIDVRPSTGLMALNSASTLSPSAMVLNRTSISHSARAGITFDAVPPFIVQTLTVVPTSGRATA
jgi:hypothetical protein